VRLLTVIACLASFACIQLGSETSNAQEVRKAVRDYKTDRVFNYQPTDPSFRGKLFNIQTKHYGKFYNCDGEEAKRNSPYICWKPHTDKDFPPHVRMIDCIRQDLSEVRQRVKDGAGACYKENCSCSQCQSVQPVESCGCAQCASASTGSAVSQIAVVENHQAVKQASIQDDANGKFGLVRGKIVDPTIEASSRVANAGSETVGSNKKSLIELIKKR